MCVAEASLWVHLRCPTESKPAKCCCVRSASALLMILEKVGPAWRDGPKNKGSHRCMCFHQLVVPTSTLYTDVVARQRAHRKRKGVQSCARTTLIYSKHIKTYSYMYRRTYTFLRCMSEVHCANMRTRSIEKYYRIYAPDPPFILIFH